MSMTKADLVEQVTEAITRTAGPTISKKDCARVVDAFLDAIKDCLLYTSPSPRDRQKSRMPSSA